MKTFLRVVFVSLALVFCFADTGAQQIRTEFGKNRIQYTDDMYKWWMYETENFIVYWYGKGRNIAESAVQIAEFAHPDIQNLVEHRINDKIEIVVYTDASDLLQSNIGNEETFETRGATTKVIGSRIFVFFDGNHINLQRRIKEGIAQVYINAMYAKGSLQGIVDSDPDLQVPQWYQDGLPSYVGGEWDALMEDELRDLWHFRKGKFQKFDRLANEYPRVAGHAMFHYLASAYGQTSVTTLLYLMRLRGDLDENLEFILGFDAKRLKRDWKLFYEKLYEAEKDKFDAVNEEDQLLLGYKKWWPKTTMNLNPNGDKMIYVVNNKGKYQMVLRDVASGDQETIFKYGSKNAVQQADYNYPIVAWHPYRPEVTIVYEDRDIIKLRRLDLETGVFEEQDVPENFQRVYNVDYITDEDYIFNGVTEGFSDLYIYKSKGRQTEAITNDFYDDIDASYVQLGEQWGILFSSNRPSTDIIEQDLDTILPTAEYDIFFLPLDSDYALRLTNTPGESEMQPHLADGRYITYLSNKTGVNNQYVLDVNTRRPAYAISNYDRSIITHEVIKNSDKVFIQQYTNGAYQVSEVTPNWTSSVTPFLTTSANVGLLQKEEKEKNIPPPIVKEVPTTSFQSRFDDPPAIESLEDNIGFNIVKRSFQEPYAENGKDREVLKFYPARAVAARRMFKLEDFSVRADNTVLFEGLESYVNGDAEIEAQQTGILVKGTVKDLFEDWKVDLGMRIPTTFDGSEFFAVADDRRKRIDKRYALYRKQNRTEQFGGPNQPNIKQRETSFIALHRQSYPFDTYRSVRGTLQLRVDQSYLQHTTTQTSEFPEFNEKRISLKGEYVFDNTIGVDLNLMHGTRYKVYAEFINRFDLQVGNDWELDASRGYTTVVGFDARHYQPFLRNSVLAFRTAGATSFGSDKILYYVGGTDGWVNPTFNNEIPVPQDENFAYKTIAPNLRGFNHNIRNGRSFLIGSAELRIPLFKYFSARELKSKFLRNIQLVAFVDGGSAWHGLYPSIDDNPLNTVILNQKGVEVTLDLKRSTFVYGYGFGARINLLGYFIRGDYAWGVESGLRQDAKLTFSLGTDF